MIDCHGSKKLKRVLLAHEWLRDLGYIVFDDRKYNKMRNNVVLAHLLQERLGVKGNLEKILRKAISSILCILSSDIKNKLMNQFIGQDSVIIWPQNLIDYKRSVVFNFQPGINGFRLNLKDREPNGIVDPEDYLKIREEIIENLKRLNDPISGEALFETVYPKEDLCSDIDDNMLPDIIAVSSDNATCKLVGNMIYCKNAIEHPFVVKCEEAKYFGEHTSEGIYIYAGPCFSRGRGDTFNLKDMAALILYLHDIPIPDSIDAIIPFEIFTKEYSHRPVEYQKRIPIHERKTESLLDSKDKKDIEERLKGLGYL